MFILPKKWTLDNNEYPVPTFEICIGLLETFHPQTDGQSERTIKCPGGTEYLIIVSKM